MKPYRQRLVSFIFAVSMLVERSVPSRATGILRASRVTYPQFGHELREHPVVPGLLGTV